MAVKQVDASDNVKKLDGFTRLGIVTETIVFSAIVGIAVGVIFNSPINGMFAASLTVGSFVGLWHEHVLKKTYNASIITTNKELIILKRVYHAISTKEDMEEGIVKDRKIIILTQE